MTKEELRRHLDKLYGAYQSIPLDAFRNAITYESILTEENRVENTEHSKSLPLPAGMMPLRKVDTKYIGFYPVYFYDTSTIGVCCTYYSTKEAKEMTFGPFRTSEDFYAEFSKYEGIGIYDFLCEYLKADTNFILTYQQAYQSQLMKLQQLNKDEMKFPLMRTFDLGSYLGVTLRVATEAVINPYTYGTPMMRVINMSSFEQVITVSYSEFDISNYKPFESKTITKMMKTVKTAIKARRAKENELLKEISNL